MPESPQEAYKRGRVDARLDQMDRHFETINGSIEKTANELHGVLLALQRISDQQVANAATVVTTAAALKDAEEARRARTEQSWSPWQKLFAVVAAVGVPVGLVLAWLALH